jgi:hypothetical protein
VASRSNLMVVGALDGDGLTIYCSGEINNGAADEDVVGNDQWRGR